ncbi:hypothetical protein NSZ01_20910 [Nocardioides szechwanensis]|uniref:Uncharacterized protein n=1 Tax=Nocardioides szechwanensis TaxID=1005944 RepID=A0A1H0HXU6_9ACTN|nr:hypothetical protein [Nocardioides szechwanensis]GEP34323.1 hypothetical protein NSZ01_20910 [Nocardioides szechwanensis]SDO23987.1 hypothetical protein SAMN05192576_3611 [Nocardioides szechwanensis]
MDLNASRWTSVEGSDYEFDDRSAGGEWLRVRGGGLSDVLEVKFALVGGTFRLTGLQFDSGRPLEARLLREPRIQAIEAAFASYRPRAVERLSDAHEHFEGLPAGDMTDAEAEDHYSTLRVLDQMQASEDAWTARLSEAGEAVPLRPRGRGASPPSDQELASFARELTKQQLAGRGAVTRTSASIGINRSTAYRWIETCRERGYLPPKEDRQ